MARNVGIIDIYMKKTFKLLIATVAIFGLIGTTQVSAQAPRVQGTGTDAAPGVQGGGTGGAPTVQGAGTGVTVPDQAHRTYDNSDFAKLPNPLGGVGVNSVSDGFEKVLDILIMVGVPFITVMIIWTGFQFVQAQGNKDKLKTAKQTLLAVIIGSALLIGAGTIANGIAKTVERIGTPVAR
jgi:hypothetical protein